LENLQREKKEEEEEEEEKEGGIPNLLDYVECTNQLEHLHRSLSPL
jgi:hypothetical protein